MLDRFEETHIRRRPVPVGGRLFAKRDSSQFASSPAILRIELVNPRLEWFSEEP